MLLLSVSWKHNDFTNFTYFAPSNCCMHCIPAIVTSFMLMLIKSPISQKTSINEQGCLVFGADNNKVSTEITIGTYLHFRDSERRKDEKLDLNVDFSFQTPREEILVKLMQSLNHRNNPWRTTQRREEHVFGREGGSLY